MPLARRRRARSNVVPFPHRGPAARVYNDAAVPIEVQPARRRLERFRLGEWLVIPAEGRLLGGGESRRLEPRTMEVLVCLAERAPGVVSKNALIDAVWEGGFIAEGTLTNAVAELRAALGDDARNPRFIETIPKRGYRLLVPPSFGDEEGRTDSSSAPRHRPWRLWAAAALVLSAALAVVLLLRTAPPALDPGRVLIVPLVNRSGDPALAYLGDLAADRFAAGLSSSGLAQPLPIAGPAVPADLEAISTAARERGAGLALIGASYLHEGKVELQVQIVDATEGALLYAVPPEIAPRAQLEGALDRVVQRALGAVATHLQGHAHNRLLSRPPLFEAYREFIAGSELYDVDYPEAVRHLERAVAIDPGFVSAQLRLAMGYRILGRNEEAVGIVRQLVRRRESLTDFERLWVDCFDAWFADRTEERLRLLREIGRQVPDDTTVTYLIASTALRLNRPHEARQVAQSLGQAPEWMARAPMTANFYAVRAEAEHRVGAFAEELRVARDGLQHFPSQLRLREAELRALAAMGDRAGIAGVLAAAQTSTLSNPSRFRPALAAAAAARAHGHPELAEELAAGVGAELGDELQPDGDPELLWAAARALAHAGELARAQGRLEELRRGHPGFNPFAVAAWLGAVAARRGEIGVAENLEAELATAEGAPPAGGSAYARAAIAAWLGHREHAVELLQQAQREGWGSFSLLHDSDRILFEPLLGMPEYEAILQPPE